MNRPGPFRFGSSSAAQLATVHEDLRRVLERAIEIFDFSVTEGRRSIETRCACRTSCGRMWTRRSRCCEMQIPASRRVQ